MPGSQRQVHSLPAGKTGKGGRGLDCLTGCVEGPWYQRGWAQRVHTRISRRRRPHTISCSQQDDGSGTERYVVNPDVEVPMADRELMSGLMELGFLFK